MFRIALLLGLLGAGATAHAAPLSVAVSIKPVHALVAGVMAGVGEPELIVKGAESPHNYVLRPSDAQILAHAGVIFWIGPLETFLEKPLTAVAGKAEIVALAVAPGISMRMGRGGDATTIDGHLWLDVDNAKAMVAVITKTLARRDGANAARYRENATGLLQRLDTLDDALRKRLAPVAGRPFIVYHDAYQYFERRYGLSEVGFVAVSPERPPGAKRIAELKAQIARTPSICVFAEPEFRPKLMDMLAGDAARTATLDPEGAALTPGPELYFDLMTGLADSLARCLAAR